MIAAIYARKSTETHGAPSSIWPLHQPRTQTSVTFKKAPKAVEKTAKTRPMPFDQSDDSN